MHSEPFKAVSMTPRNRAIAASLGTQDPRVLQSMVICKQPEIGGAVPSHQDSTFLYTDPPSAVGFWYALEDCTQENGCLSFERGSHATSPVKERFVRAEGGGTKFEPLPEGKGNGLDSRGVPGGWEVGEVKAGTLVLIHGTVNHRSERNLSQKSRFIYTFHGKCIQRVQRGICADQTQSLAESTNMTKRIGSNRREMGSPAWMPLNKPALITQNLNKWYNFYECKSSPLLYSSYRCSSQLIAYLKTPFVLGTSSLPVLLIASLSAIAVALNALSLL